MATEESANPWVAAGEAVRNRAMRTQDQAAATQDEGSATHDESAATQDAAVPGDHPLRIARGDMTQQELADASGVSRRRISQIESRIKGASAEIAANLAAALNTTPEALGFAAVRPPAELSTHPLAVARRSAGLSQTELAARAGVSASVISRIEGGQSAHAQPEQAHAIAGALDGDVKSLGLSPRDLNPVAELRWAQGKTQEQLADEAGLNVSVVARAENSGASLPFGRTRAALAKALGVDQARLFPALEEYQPVNQVREYREAAELSQRELADIVGADQGTISRIENGKQVPHPELAGRIAVALRTNATVFDAPPPSENERLNGADHPLARARAELGYSQAELASLAGVQRSVVSRIETGRHRSVTQSHARAIAGVFGADPAELGLVPEAMHPLEAARTAANLTQEELAEASGVSYRTILRIETGQTSYPRTKGRDALAETLGVAPEELFPLSEQRTLHDARLATGMTQAQLALASGLPKSVVAEVESGTVEPAPDVVRALSIGLSIASQTAGGSGPPPSAVLDFDVAEVRNHLQLTQAELADRAGVHEATVSNAERERYGSPRRATVEGIRSAVREAVTEAIASERFDTAPLRAAFGLTVGELAELSGVDADTIRAIESGAEETPGPSATEALRAALTDVAADFEAAERPLGVTGAEPDREMSEGKVSDGGTPGFSNVGRDREVADLSVGELSELSGVPVATIRRMEADPGYEPGEAVQRAVREGFNKADVLRFADVAAEDTRSAEAASEGRGVADDRMAAPAAEGSISVPVGPLTVDVPDAPARPDLPPAPPLPPHLEQMGPQAAYFDASMRGFPAGRQAGAEAAARAEVPWGREEGAAGGTPVLKVDRGGERLNEARRTASDNDVEADEQVGVDWEAEAPLTAPVGAAAAGQEADALREATFSATTATPSGLTAAQVHQQRFEQAAWDGFQQGWAQTMAERALLAAQDHSELAAPDVTPDMRAEALAAIGHAPSAAPQASTAAGPGQRTEAEAGPEPRAEAGPEAGSDTGPDTGPEPGSDAGSQAGPNAGRQVGSDAGPQAGPEAGRGGGPEAGPEAGRAAGPGAGLGVGSHAGSQVGSEARPQVGSDAGSEAGREAGSDTGPQTGPDAGPQVGPDTGSQAGSDAGREAGSDAGPDAGREAGSDAGPDAGRGAGREAGPQVGSDAGQQAGPNAGRGAGPEVESDAGAQVGPEAGRGVGREAGPQAGPDAGRGAGRAAGPQVAAQPDGTSGARSGARDAEPSREASGPEPASEPAPKSGPEPGPPTGQSAGAVREAAHEKGSAAGRTGSADAGLAVPASSQLSGPAPGARADPALLGLSAPGTRSATAPERSVDTSVPTPAPAPAPAPEPSPSPALELEQSKEV